jgi:hypothetical protein
MPPNACTSRGRRAPLQHAAPRGAVPDARSAILPRGALSYWREHSTGHACPASHAPRTSRPSMSRAIRAGIWFFRPSWGSCWSFVEAAARCRKSSDWRTLEACSPSRHSSPLLGVRQTLSDCGGHNGATQSHLSDRGKGVERPGGYRRMGAAGRVTPSRRRAVYGTMSKKAVRRRPDCTCPAAHSAESETAGPMRRSSVWPSRCVN